MIKTIRNSERYHFESDWLSTYWHFSFDHYYDPANMNFGPLRVFNDDVIRPAKGFPMHGHREMEIITYVLEGELEHKDNAGGFGRIRAGEVQRMSAGRGISHSEYNPSPTEAVHLMQMWITPSVSGLDPSYEQLRFTQDRRSGRLLPVASGGDVPGAVSIHQDATLYVSRMLPDDEISHVLAEGRRAYLFVIEGGLQINGEQLDGGDQARVSGERELKLAARGTSEIVLIDLP